MDGCTGHGAIAVSAPLLSRQTPPGAKGWVAELCCWSRLGTGVDPNVWVHSEVLLHGMAQLHPPRELGVTACLCFQHTGRAGTTYRRHAVGRHVKSRHSLEASTTIPCNKLACGFGIILKHHQQLSAPSQSQRPPSSSSSSSLSSSSSGNTCGRSPSQPPGAISG